MRNTSWHSSSWHDKRQKTETILYQQQSTICCDVFCPFPDSVLKRSLNWRQFYAVCPGAGCIAPQPHLLFPACQFVIHWQVMAGTLRWVSLEQRVSGMMGLNAELKTTNRIVTHFHGALWGAECSTVPCWLNHPLTCLASRETAGGQARGLWCPWDELTPVSHRISRPQTSGWLARSHLILWWRVTWGLGWWWNIWSKRGRHTA